MKSKRTWKEVKMLCEMNKIEKLTDEEVYKYNKTVSKKEQRMLPSDLKAYTGILRFAVNYRLDKIFNRDRGNRR
jgi:hypothetical protein